MTVLALYDAANEAFLGTAFLTSKRQALTAFHCIGNRFENKLVHGAVCLRRDALSNVEPVNAKLIWHDPDLDVALLELEENLPDAPPFSVCRKVKRHQPFAAKGFPGGKPMTVTGKITEVESVFEGKAPIIELFCHQSSANQGLSLHGLSGGPVIVDDTVVGIIRYNPPGHENQSLALGGTVFAVPIHVFMERCKAFTDFQEIKPPPDTQITIGRTYQLPMRNPYFTGREEVLAALDKGFEEKSATAVIRQASTGLGGVGKTTLAVEYAHRFDHRYNLIAFLDAGSPSILSTSLLGLANHLKLYGENAEEKLAQLRHWLAGHTSWLLIADNADDPDALKAIQDFIPNPAMGHLLITTRMAKPTGIIREKTQRIDVFTREEAVAFLRAKIAPDPEDHHWLKAAERLAEELGYLPRTWSGLSLEMAA